MRRQPLTRHHTLFFCLLVAPILHATTTTAGGFVVSCQSDGLYDGDEWSELLRSVATIVVILAASHEDEDDDADFLSHGGRREDGRALAQGTSVGLQTGLLLMMSEDASWLLQRGFQIDRFPDLVDAPLQSRGATIGLRLALQ